MSSFSSGVGLVNTFLASSKIPRLKPAVGYCTPYTRYQDRIKHLKQMYANPDYKEFNRGSHKDVPDGWWDDFPPRCNQRSWKKHRKHQWKEKKE